MKILQIIPSLTSGGAEKIVENLSFEFKKRGHFVEIVSLYYLDTTISKNLSCNGFKVHMLSKKRGFDFSIVCKIKKILYKFKPDIIHTHLNVLKYVGLADLSLKTPIIHTIHNIADKEVGKIDRIINSIFYKTKLATPVALSSLISDTFVQKYHFKKSEIHIVPNGVDLNRCIKKDEYHISNEVKIITVGRLTMQKNHKRMFDAISLLKKSNLNVKLTVIGEGELLGKLLMYTKEMNLDSNIFLLGFKENVLEYLHESDIFVLSSDYEGVPIVLLEAMGTGLPIVSTNVGGIRNILNSGVDSILVNTDAFELADAITTFASSYELRNKYGNAAFEHSKAFSSQKMADDYLKIYDEFAN